MSRPLRIGLVGARGYVGGELVKLLAAPDCDVELAWLTSSSELDRPVKDRIPHAPEGLRFVAPDPSARLREDVDVVVLALPNGESRAWVEAVDKLVPETVLIDLSADQRGAGEFVYGLPARRRAALSRARRIANPGCYATAVQIALDPLLPWLHGAVHAFGVSGYSGAGTAPSPRNDPERLRDNVFPYALVNHGHEREISAELDHPVRLLPHVAPFFRGISVTLAGRFDRILTRAEILDRMNARYADEPLVRIMDEVPLVRDVTMCHDVVLGGVEVARDGRQFAMVATVDNLLGGAATTALRNVNLATGRPELKGIAP